VTLIFDNKFEVFGTQLIGKKMTGKSKKLLAANKTPSPENLRRGRYQRLDIEFQKAE
jgi:hypothetical protein